LTATRHRILHTGEESNGLLNATLVIGLSQRPPGT
jgi:hypothetical protein